MSIKTLLSCSVLSLIMSAQSVFAQETGKQTSESTETLSTSVTKDSSASTANNVTDDKNVKAGAKDFAGLSVSPSTLHFSLKPGTSKMMEVKITNDTKQKYTFQANFSDFVMNTSGKPAGVKNGESKYGLSQWTTISPSYFELQPGETKKIAVTVNVPNSDSSNHAAWTVLMLDEVTQRAPLAANGTPSTIALGITPSIGFGVYLYQNPPGVHSDQIDISKFSYRDSSDKKQLFMNAGNKGDGIGFCTSYVELTHMKSGKQEKLKGQKFTILPGFERRFVYEIPKDLPKGKYSAVGVIDTNNPDQVTAAETEFIIE